VIAAAREAGCEEPADREGPLREKAEEGSEQPARRGGLLGAPEATECGDGSVVALKANQYRKPHRRGGLFRIPAWCPLIGWFGVCDLLVVCHFLVLWVAVGGRGGGGGSGCDVGGQGGRVGVRANREIDVQPVFKSTMTPRMIKRGGKV